MLNLAAEAKKFGFGVNFFSLDLAKLRNVRYNTVIDFPPRTLVRAEMQRMDEEFESFLQDCRIDYLNSLYAMVLNQMAAKTTAAKARAFLCFLRNKETGIRRKTFCSHGCKAS